MHMRRLGRGAVAVILLAGAACGSGSGVTGAGPSPASSTTPPTTTSTSPPSPTIHGSPPPVTVRSGSTEYVLQPWTFCYQGLCADGSPTQPLDRIVGGDNVSVEFPLPGWSFDASFRQSDMPCSRMQTVPLADHGDGTF